MSGIQEEDSLGADHWLYAAVVMADHLNEVLDRQRAYPKFILDRFEGAYLDIARFFEGAGIALSEPNEENRAKLDIAIEVFSLSEPPVSRANLSAPLASYIRFYGMLLEERALSDEELALGYQVLAFLKGLISLGKAAAAFRRLDGLSRGDAQILNSGKKE